MVLLLLLFGVINIVIGEDGMEDGFGLSHFISIQSKKMILNTLQIVFFVYSLESN